MQVDSTYNRGVIPSQTLTIGQLARAAKVPTSTVRFYERRGMLRADARTGANYRAYAPAAVERLRFIRAAQASGFSLKDVAEMLALTASEEPPCPRVAEVMDRRLADVRERLRELRRVERTLRAARETCCRGGPDWCGEIETLKGRDGGECREPQCPPGERAGKKTRRKNSPSEESRRRALTLN